MPHGTELLHDGDALVRTGALAVAVLLALWHALGVVCCAAARRWPERRALLAATRWCPPLTRGFATATITAGIALAPAAAPAQTLAPPTSTSTPAAETPFVRAPASPAPSAPPPAFALPPAPTPPTARQHVVVAGDNLWRIAAAEVQRRTGGADPSDAAIATYWREVVAVNASSLRSGDPSLIHPGEIVTMPGA
jgi:nucleoid-associated protein YgaU